MKKIINTSNAPNPVGPYNQAILFDGTLYLSGQIALDPINMKMQDETIETETDVNDIIVTFTDDSYTPNKTHTRNVNVVYDADGAYDNAATLVRIEEVMAGVEHKMKVGVIS